MLDILTIVHNLADTQTASRIRRTCRRLGALIPQPVLYNKPSRHINYEYRVGSKLHRLDGPAREGIERDECWYRGGIRHREYYPQYNYRRSKYYRVDGVLHREASPSIIRGEMWSWRSRGILHRKIGPAYNWYGDVKWFTAGKLHRLDSPAYGDIYAIRSKHHRISGSMRNQWLVDGITIRQ